MSNEWSPPTTDLSVPPTGVPGEPQPLGSIGELLSASWEQLRTHPWPSVMGVGLGFGGSFAATFLLYIVMFVAIMVATLVGLAVAEGIGLEGEDAELMASAMMAVAMVFLYPFMFMVFMPIQAVFLRGGLATARGEDAHVSDLLRRPLRLALTGAALVLLMLLGLIPAMLLLYIPAVYLGLRWSLALHYLVDTELGAVDCLKASWRATEGKVLDLFLKNLVFGFAAMFGILITCYLGMFVIVPLQMVFGGLIYMRLSGRTTSGLPDPVLS